MLNEILNRIIDIFNLIGKDSVELKEVEETHFKQSIPCYILVLQLALNKTAQNVHSFEILKSLNFYQNAISVIRNQLELNAKLYAPLLMSNNFNELIVQLFIEGGKIKDKVYQQHESFLEINKMINKPDYINTLYSKMCKMAHPTACLTLDNMYDNHHVYPMIIRDEKDIINQVNVDGKDSDKNIKIQDLMNTMNEILEITEQIFTKYLNQKNNKSR